MKIIGLLFLISSIIFCLLGLRSYRRDKAYAKESVVSKSSVKWVEIKPNSGGKPVASITLMLSYRRDDVIDSFEHNFPLFFSKEEPLPTIERLKAATPYVRYLPGEKRNKNIPDWVMVSSKDNYEGLYGESWFNWMFKSLALGIMLLIYNRTAVSHRRRR